MPKEQLKTLTEQMYFVLLILKDEKCGVEITEEVRKLTEDRVVLGPGTLYAMLAKFEEEGLIEETKNEARKRWYQITHKGNVLLLSEFARLQKMIIETKKLI